MTGYTTPSLHSFFDSRKLDTKTSHILSKHSASSRQSRDTRLHSAGVHTELLSERQLWGGDAASLLYSCELTAAQRYWWVVWETLYPSRPSRSCYHYIYIPRYFIGPPCLTSTFTLGLLLLTLTYLTPRCMPVNVLSYFRETWELRERKWSV